MKSPNTDLLSVHEETMARDDDCGDDHVVNKARKYDRSSVQRRLSIRCADRLLDWIIFPLLLFVQFGTTMYFQQNFGALELQWVPTMGLISVFCITSIKYRNVFRVHPIQSMTILLLPEVFTNIVLATVLFANELLTAYYTLVALTAALLIAAAIGHIQRVEYERSMTELKLGDYKLLHPQENDHSEDEWVC